MARATNEPERWNRDFRVCDTDFLNHRIEVTAGVLEEECREMMQEFFRARRVEAKDEGGRMKDDAVRR